MRHCTFALVVWLSLANLSQVRADDDPQATEFFSTRVLPLLREHCFECHSHEGEEASGNLVLDSRSAILQGGSRGKAYDETSPHTSLLLRAVQFDDSDLQMPPSGKLDDASIATLRQWLEGGAVMPSSMQAESRAFPARDSRSSTAESHWAYQSPQRWLADIDQSPQATNFIDAIISQKLHQADLKLSPPADRATLLKRLCYDLSGLPPTVETMRGFIDEARSDQVVISEAIDRLLASPQFGERWARAWMDISRYADTKGYVFQEDREYAEAYKYRDWLIQSFNRDLPYDQFVTQQLAADLTGGSPNGADCTSDLPALGFLTLGRRFLNNQHDIIDDRLDVVSRGLMGMTLACARCHDHKYDPVTQADYYAMYGVFLNTEEPGGEPWPHRLVDTNAQRDSHILLRGSPANRGDKVERRFVSLLAPDQTPFANGSGRLELAEHIVSASNPLTARVFVNRVWMRLTGSSLVESPSDFGTRCPPPRQLELLDQLALKLIEGHWSMKSLVRSIVTSDVYQQSSRYDIAGFAVDPENMLYWRMNRRRLDFEAFRDTLLARAGQLDLSMFGKSEAITTAPFSHRRTVYAYIDRQNLPQVFRTFDVASPDTHSPVRAQTSVPQQGLFLLNSDFVDDLSRHLAQRAREATAEDKAVSPAAAMTCQVRWMFEQVFCRVPDESELRLLLEFVKDETDTSPANPNRLVELAGALLAANELAYID